jgi:hypothetical protein
MVGPAIDLVSRIRDRIDLHAGGHCPTDDDDMTLMEVMMWPFADLQTVLAVTAVVAVGAAVLGWMSAARERPNKS